MSKYTITRKEYEDMCLDEHGKFHSPFRHESLHDLLLMIDLDSESRDDIHTAMMRTNDAYGDVMDLLDAVESGVEHPLMFHKLQMIENYLLLSQHLLRNTLERMAMPDIVDE
jgi:hypothetical protein